MYGSMVVVIGHNKKFVVAVAVAVEGALRGRSRLLLLFCAV